MTTQALASVQNKSRMAVHVVLLLWLWLLLTMTGSSAYEICASNQGGGICPDHDTCCPTSTPGVSSCISSKEDEAAVCCFDGDDDGDGVIGVTTGCPHGYECLSKQQQRQQVNNSSASTIADNSNNNDRQRRRNLRSEPNDIDTGSGDDSNNVDHDDLYCHRIDPDYNGPKPKPLVLPRYQLTTLPPKVFTQVYGLSLLEGDDVSGGGNNGVHGDDKHQFATNNDSTDRDENDDDTNRIVNLAYFSSMGSLDSSDSDDLQSHQRVTTVLIMVHGSGRTAEDYLYGAVSSLPKDQQDPSNATMMVLSPWFLDPDDDDDDDDEYNTDIPVVDLEFNDTTATATTTTNATIDDYDQQEIRADHRHRHRHSHESIPIPLPPNTLRWFETSPVLYHTWRYGANAINSTLSSFAAVDRLVERLVEDPVRFPSLQRIVVAGHSAGGQFVQRWAMLSNSPVWKEPSQQHHFVVSDDADIAGGDSVVAAEPSPFMGSRPQRSKQRNVRIRVIPANPRCFAMLDDRRYVYNYTANTTVFQRPDNSVIEQCPDFNEWIWGLDAGGDVVAPYKDRAVADAGGARSLAHRYVTQRNVVYLAGGQDLQVFFDDCGSVLQGETRRERSRKFMASLYEMYPQEMKAKLHTRLVVPGVPHDHTLMFQSPAGQQALFGDDH